MGPFVIGIIRTDIIGNGDIARYDVKPHPKCKMQHTCCSERDRVVKKKAILISAN